jgi:hypothetical protein
MAKHDQGTKKKRPRGPEPERLKVEGEWEDAVKTALKKPPPPRAPEPAKKDGQR